MADFRNLTKEQSADDRDLKRVREVLGDERFNECSSFRGSLLSLNWAAVTTARCVPCEPLAGTLRNRAIVLHGARRFVAAFANVLERSRTRAPHLSPPLVSLRRTYRPTAEGCQRITGGRHALEVVERRLNSTGAITGALECRTSARVSALAPRVVRAIDLNHEALRGCVESAMNKPAANDISKCFCCALLTPQR